MAAAMRGARFEQLPSPGPIEYGQVIDASARDCNLSRAEYWYDRAVQDGAPLCEAMEPMDSEEGRGRVLRSSIYEES